MVSPHSALGELRELLAANGSADDPVRVASAIVELSRKKNWHESHSELAGWMERLAFDVAATLLTQTESRPARDPRT